MAGARWKPSFLQYARLFRGSTTLRESIGIDGKHLGTTDATGAFDLLVLEDVGHLFHVLEVKTLRLSLFSDECYLYFKSGPRK